MADGTSGTGHDTEAELRWLRDVNADLLAACEGAYEHFAWLLSHGAVTREEEPHIEALRAAIAKARGAG